jgi:hypothetical protein
MNPIAEFLASNVSRDGSIFLIFGAAVLVVAVMAIPYLLYTRFLNKKARQHFLDNLDNTNITDQQRVQMVANKQYPLPKKYANQLAWCGFAFLFSTLGLMVAVMGTTVWPVLNSYSDCSRTVEGTIIVPGYEEQTREFTLCRKREYYGAAWSDWYVADKVYNQEP